MKQLFIKKTFKNKMLKVLSKKNRVYVITAMVMLIAVTAGVDNCLKEVKIMISLCLKKILSM